MKIEFSDNGRKDFLSLQRPLQIFFKKHFEKLCVMPPRRHLKAGLPYFVGNVTKAARFAYDIQGDTLFIVRFFATHKEYEKWFKSFK